MNKRLPLLLIALLTLLSAVAQDKIRLYGKVMDEYDNPVEFASIIVERQGAFAVSGTEGGYSLRCNRTDSLFIT